MAPKKLMKFRRAAPRTKPYSEYKMGSMMHGRNVDWNDYGLTVDQLRQVSLKQGVGVNEETLLARYRHVKKKKLVRSTT